MDISILAISNMDISILTISILDISMQTISILDTSNIDISWIYLFYFGYILRGYIRGYIQYFDISMLKKIYLLLDISIDIGYIHGYIRNLDISIVDISMDILRFWIYPWIYPNNSLLSCSVVQLCLKTDR